MRSQARERAAGTAEATETEEPRAETTVADGAIMTMTSRCDNRKLPIPANCNVPTAPTRVSSIYVYKRWDIILCKRCIISETAIILLKFISLDLV
jgi:hypothetical protein